MFYIYCFMFDLYRKTEIFQLENKSSIVIIDCMPVEYSFLTNPYVVINVVCNADFVPVS